MQFMNLFQSGDIQKVTDLIPSEFIPIRLVNLGESRYLEAASKPIHADSIFTFWSESRRSDTGTQRR